MKPQFSQQPPPPVAAIVHIYRGLMDRAATWRVRIDASTNWAVVTSGTAVSFTLSDAVRSHAVLLLTMLMIVAFLIIEARRTRYYDLWSSWVRLMEIDYFAPILRENVVTSNTRWQELLVRELDFPHFKSSFLRMFVRRLRDNYLWILLFLIVSWMLKLLLHSRSDLGPGVADTFVNRASIGPIPGNWVMAVVVGSYALVVVLVLIFDRRTPAIEAMSDERLFRKMASPSQQPVFARPFEPRPIPLHDEPQDPRVTD